MFSSHLRWKQTRKSLKWYLELLIIKLISLSFKMFKRRVPHSRVIIEHNKCNKINSNTIGKSKKWRKQSCVSLKIKILSLKTLESHLWRLSKPRLISVISTLFHRNSTQRAIQIKWKWWFLISVRNKPRLWAKWKKTWRLPKRKKMTTSTKLRQKWTCFMPRPRVTITRWWKNFRGLQLNSTRSWWLETTSWKISSLLERTISNAASSWSRPTLRWCASNSMKLMLRKLKNENSSTSNRRAKWPLILR